MNVRFTAVDAFEFTGETAIFDLLRLPLVHGWLVDPADAVTAAAVGTMSYNELVERLVGGAAPAEQAAALEHFLEFSASQARGGFSAWKSPVMFAGPCLADCRRSAWRLLPCRAADAVRAGDTAQPRGGRHAVRVLPQQPLLHGVQAPRRLLPARHGRGLPRAGAARLGGAVARACRFA